MLVCFLFLAGVYFLRHGFYLSVLKIPVQKSLLFKRLLILVALLILTGVLEKALYWSVLLNGKTLYGQPLNDLPFYLILVLLIGLYVWKSTVYSPARTAANNRITLIGIEQHHAMPTLYAVLSKLGLPYQLTGGGIRLVGKNIAVDVTVQGNNMHFQVAQAIDKLFLETLCQAYQNHYRELKLPLADTYAALALFLGIALTMLAGLIATNWLPLSYLGQYF